VPAVPWIDCVSRRPRTCAGIAHAIAGLQDDDGLYAPEGIGGFGISQITATGEVYNLSDIGYFPGAYIQARAGFAIGNVSAGELWLQNSNGVVLHLKAERVGLALSLGGDAIYIRMD
jgi:hypothetical protein